MNSSLTCFQIQRRGKRRVSQKILWSILQVQIKNKKMTAIKIYSLIKIMHWKKTTGLTKQECIDSPTRSRLKYNYPRILTWLLVLNFNCSHELALLTSKNRRWHVISTSIKIEIIYSVKVTHSSLAAFLELAYSRALKTEAYLWLQIIMTRMYMLAARNSKLAAQSCKKTFLPLNSSR